MRSIARQSARLAGSSQLRATSHSRRFPAQQPQHNRGLSRSSLYNTDNRGPGGPPESFNPFETRREDQEHDAHGAKPGEQEKETGDAKGTDNHKSGQSSSIGSNARSYRARRNKSTAPETPAPPPVPKWFLDHNVRLQAEPVRTNTRSQNAQVLRCVDSESGHTVFLIPHYESWPVGCSSTVTSERAQSHDDASSRKSLDQTFFDNKFPTVRDKPTLSTESTSILKAPSKETDKVVNAHTLLRWAVLEAEASVRAGFSMATRGSQPQSHAASRVDISLRCPDSHSHDQMDELVEDLANLTGSNVIRLDANDVGELAADYVGQGSDALDSISNLAYDVFEGYSLSPSKTGRPAEEDEEDEDDEMEEDDEEQEEPHRGSFGNGISGVLESLRKALHNRRNGVSPGLSGEMIAVTPVGIPVAHARSSSDIFRPIDTKGSLDWDESRLRALLDSLLDAPQLKKDAVTPPEPSVGFQHRIEIPPEGDRNHNLGQLNKSSPESWRHWRGDPDYWYPDVAGVLAGHISRSADEPGATSRLKLEALRTPTNESNSECAVQGPGTIVHLRDLQDLCNSRNGEIVVRNLVQVARKRRIAGEQVVIIGTTALDTGAGRLGSVGQEVDAQEFRPITVPPFMNMTDEEFADYSPGELQAASAGKTTYRRILEINLRHIQTMLRRLRPGEDNDLFNESSKVQLSLGGTQILKQKVLSFDDVQRLVQVAIGLSLTHAKSDHLTAVHIGLAAYVTAMADQAARAWSDHKFHAESTATKAGEGEEAGNKIRSRLDKIRRTCTPHEARLLPGVVDAKNIKTGFDQVHAPSETLDALKSLTSLSLLRPDAFKYGVLAADRLPGLMLYGPPGTGKTLLAKAVAKESQAAVLEISGAQIYEKYVGEGEKMVRAVFSLAKKLSPCIVFIDEADAIFGSRSSAGNRNTHREIINQFLREWDGMDMHNVFIMVASNRPFDMDDAVLRRLPRRLLVDLPVARDRECILQIHLKDELLDETVSLAELAEQTPLYSGSDLKNLCIAAALACVREENELARSHDKKDDFRLPDKRTLSKRHFDQAVKEISASISEDMSSLTAIRKFDEQYGDRRGRRKKTAYGFGASAASAAVDESAVRVRPAP